jgi:hypothetical protein
MYHKSHGYRLGGGSLYFGPGPNLVRKSQHDLPPHGVAPNHLGFDTGPLPPTTPFSSDQREKQNGTAAVDIRSESAKKVLKVAPLISLEEAQRREVSRKNRATDRALEKEVRIEREVSRLKREVAEIARKKAQARRKEESIAHLEKEGQGKREYGSTLTAAVAARKDGLLVAPTNWIVPLISLDEARNTEKAKRNAVETKGPIPLPSPSPSALTPVNLLTVNAGNGNFATLRLISLEEARGRDRTRRLEEEVVSRTRMHARAGTGLSHVSLITLAEAREQDALRRSRSSHGGFKPKLSGSMFRSQKARQPPSSSSVNQVIETGSGDRRTSTKDASASQEKARWVALVSDAENWWTRPNTISAYRPHTNGYR